MTRWLVLSGVLGAALAQAGERVALLVSNDIGLADDQPLRYTASDVGRMSSVLIEFGQFQPADVHRLSGKTAADLLSKLDALAMNDAKRTTFYFYYSGHADAGALRMGGTTLTFDVLLRHLKAVRADLHVSILDACQSGSAARGKGVKEGPEFDVKIRDDQTAGTIFISSSAADEQSYESEEARGAVFTAHWASALRGAADKDNDGQVTLTEAYNYTYAQTLRATLLSKSGPQHPTFRWEFGGRKDPVLASLGSSAKLTIASETEATYVVFDSLERSVLAEVPIGIAERRRIALGPGSYVVKRRGSKGLAIAQVQLGKTDDRILYEYQMRTVPFVRLAKKGSFGDLWLAAAGGQFFSALGSAGSLRASLGLEWDLSRWMFFAELLFSTGTEVNEGLVSYGSLLTPVGGALYSFHFGQFAFRLGPQGGVGLYVQRNDSSDEGSRGRHALIGLLGLRLRFDSQLAERVGMFVAIDLLALAARTHDEAVSRFSVVLGQLGIFGTALYSFGVRISWQ